MRKLTSAVTAALTAVGMLAATNGSAQAATEAEYVALGDSYASGVGAYPYDSSSGSCLRSPGSYPRLWAATHPAYALTDATCSGASVADVRGSQLSALDRETALVTITVGGNDAQFSSTVQACLTKSDSYCSTATQWMSYYARNQLVGELAGLYADVKARAPRALVLVLGYPQVLAGTGSCGAIDLTTRGPIAVY